MGKRVFLVRHAKAVKRNEWKGNDCERPLTEEGFEKFREFLKVISPIFPKKIKVISSPCKRALQTAELISEKIGAPLKVDELLSPDAEPEDYEKVLKKYRGNLALVGHEPDLSLLLNYLTCLSPSKISFKKGAVAEIRRQCAS
ncbi:MAG: phosphohistidine phosphatase [Thermovibrio sp.]|nr:MAG: phosphohistidine phosphatase [Thermovibrio sp.]